MGEPSDFGIESCMDRPVRTATQNEIKAREEARQKYGVVFGDGWRSVILGKPVNILALSEVLRKKAGFGLNIIAQNNDAGIAVVTKNLPRISIGNGFWKKPTPVALVEENLLIYNPKQIEWLYAYGRQALGWPENNNYLDLLLTGEQKSGN